MIINVNNNEFAGLLSDPAVVLLDCRRADEFAAGHIPGAINIDVEQDSFEADCDCILPMYFPLTGGGLLGATPLPVSNSLSRRIAIYCRSGRRSLIAAEILSKKGYALFNLTDGILKWDGEIEK